MNGANFEKIRKQIQNPEAKMYKHDIPRSANFVYVHVGAILH